MRFVLLLLVGFFLTACGEEKVQFSDLEIRDGKYYIKEDDKPYTGEILEHRPFGETVPIFSSEKITFQRELLSHEYIEKSLHLDKKYVTPALPAAALFTITDGRLNGDYIEYHKIVGEHLSQKRIVKLLGNFKQGTPHGIFRSFSVHNDRGKEPIKLKLYGREGHYAFPIFEIATFDNGNLNGDYRLWLAQPIIYDSNGVPKAPASQLSMFSSPPTISAQYQDDKLEGVLLVTSPSTKSLTFRAHYKDGLKNGLLVEYCGKNNFYQRKQKKRMNFSSNSQVGETKTFDCNRWDRNRSSSSGGSMSASQEQKLRKLAEDFYDKCQLYGKSYDSRC